MIKKIALTLVFTLVTALVPAGSANAIGEDSFPMCNVNNSVVCFESISIKGGGLGDWVTLSNPTSFTATSGRTGLQFDLAGTGYTAGLGYGTNINVTGNGFTNATNYGYTIDATSGNGAVRNDPYGTYTKHLDPSTEIRIVLNAKTNDISNYSSFNLSGGSEKVLSTSGSDKVVTLTAKVTHQTGSNSGNLGDWNAPASYVLDGVLTLRGSVAPIDSMSGLRIYDGMQIDSNGSTGSAPYRTNFEYFDGFKVMLKAPHTLTDGTTINSAYYSVVIPKVFLEAAGITQQTVLNMGIELAADYSTGATPSVIASTVTAAQNGAVRVVANGMHYSTPIMDTRFKGLPQAAKVGSSVKKGKKLTLPLKSTQGIATSWKSTSPKTCKVIASKKTTKKKVGKKTVKTVRITKWQVQGKKKGTCTVVGTNAGNGTFGPANISKTIRVR
jgi:predicted secreted protein